MSRQRNADGGVKLTPHAQKELEKAERRGAGRTSTAPNRIERDSGRGMETAGAKTAIGAITRELLKEHGKGKKPEFLIPDAAHMGVKQEIMETAGAKDAVRTITGEVFKKHEQDRKPELLLPKPSYGVTEEKGGRPPKLPIKGAAFYTLSDGTTTNEAVNRLLRSVAETSGKPPAIGLRSLSKNRPLSVSDFPRIIDFKTILDGKRIFADIIHHNGKDYVATHEGGAVKEVLREVVRGDKATKLIPRKERAHPSKGEEEYRVISKLKQGGEIVTADRLYVVKKMPEDEATRVKEGYNKTNKLSMAFYYHEDMRGITSDSLYYIRTKLKDAGEEVKRSTYAALIEILDVKRLDRENAKELERVLANTKTEELAARLHEFKERMAK